jgi:hypothetical protein
MALGVTRSMSMQSKLSGTLVIATLKTQFCQGKLKSID